MNALPHIADILVKYRQMTGRDTKYGHGIIVGPAVAIDMMRRIFTMRNDPKIMLTDDQDELFRYEDIPVRLRFNCPPGQAVIMPAKEIPPRQCCDATSMATLLICINKGNA